MRKGNLIKLLTQLSDLNRASLHKTEVSGSTISNKMLWIFGIAFCLSLVTGHNLLAFLVLVIGIIIKLVKGSSPSKFSEDHGTSQWLGQKSDLTDDISDTD